jgi:hypothetical protein
MQIIFTAGIVAGKLFIKAILKFLFVEYLVKCDQNFLKIEVVVSLKVLKADWVTKRHTPKVGFLKVNANKCI